MLELLRDETKKIASLLDVEFETSLKEAYPTNLKAARESVIKENIHLVEGLQRRGNRKWRKFEGRAGASFFFYEYDIHNKEMKNTKKNKLHTM